MTAEATSKTPLYGGIEGGGTKFICAIAHAPDRVLDRVSVATTDAHRTLAECVQFFEAAQRRHGRIAAFGFGCFGPIEINAGAPDRGRMMPTPKPGWSGVNVIEPLRASFDVPVMLDTDVGAAALAEWRLGAGRSHASLAYVTVGTGIGGAIVPGNTSAGRLMHAEMGHLPVRRDPGDAHFAGVCPFHGDCLEGLASGPAIHARWGKAVGGLATQQQALIGGYLGQLAASIALMASPARIVFGGGVMSDPAILTAIRAAACRYLNGYLEPLMEAARVHDYICAPGLGPDAGIAGALLLAMQTHARPATT